MYVTPSLISKASGSAESKSFEIAIGKFSDVQSFPGRDTGKITMLGDIVMKAGKYMTKMEVTSSATSLPTTSEGNEDNVTVSSLPEVSLPGSTLDQEEFAANHLNTSLFVAVRVGACGGGTPFWRIFGTQCAPLSLLPERVSNNDENKLMFRFQQFAKTADLPARYNGNLTFATVNTVAADATVIDVTSGPGEYQLTDNAAATAITDITNAVSGTRYTVIGSGGANPATIANGGNFALAGGVDWQGLAGARLTLSAFDIGGGNFTFFEVSRSS